MAIVLLAESYAFIKMLTVDMGLEDNIKQPNLMKGIITSSAEGVITMAQVNKPSTKKKSKKGMVKERGTNSSLKAVKSVKGVRSKSR